MGEGKGVQLAVVCDMCGAVGLWQVKPPYGLKQGRFRLYSNSNFNYHGNRCTDT